MSGCERGPEVSSFSPSKRSGELSAIRQQTVPVSHVKCATRPLAREHWACLPVKFIGNNTKVEFGVLYGPLPVRPVGHVLRMGYCSGLQQSCFRPLQYYRRSHPIPNNQLIHCPWRRGHLCTGNFIPAACLYLPFPLVSPIFLLSLCASTVSTDK